MSNYSNLNDNEKLQIIKDSIDSFPDFPKPGILFRDLFSILRDPPKFALLKEILVRTAREIQPPVECIVGLDARGFLLGPIISLELNLPFVPIRKKGKLPGKLQRVSYALEYGEDTVEIQDGAIKRGARVLIVDDLLATGGTLGAACDLVANVGGAVVGCLVVLELADLKGREKFPAKVGKVKNANRWMD